MLVICIITLTRHLMSGSVYDSDDVSWGDDDFDVEPDVEFVPNWKLPFKDRDFTSDNVIGKCSVKKGNRYRGCNLQYVVNEKMCDVWFDTAFAIVDGKNLLRDNLVFDSLSDGDVSMKIINANLNKKWDWSKISNGNIYEIDIINNLDKNWDWNMLSMNDNISFNFIINNSGPDWKWNWNYVCFNSNICWKYVSDNIDNDWDWHNLSYNKSLTFDFVLKYPDKPWNWHILSDNPTISWKFISENHDKLWNWESISKNPSITWEIIKNNPDKPWDWYYVSINPSITWKIVTSNPDEPWNWHSLSKNSSITWKIVTNNLDKPWDWDALCLNPSIDYKKYCSYIDKKSYDADADDGVDDDDNSYAYYAMCEDPKITSTFIYENRDKPWCWWNMSFNTNLNWKLVKDLPDEKWQYKALVGNKMDHCKDLKKKKILDLVFLHVLSSCE